MPDLPTLTVNDDQLARIQAAFAPPTAPDDQQAAIANYRKWLIDKLVEYVTAYEMAQYDLQMYQERRAQQVQIQNDLSTDVT